jgi:hypothetical protein
MLVLAAALMLRGIHLGVVATSSHALGLRAMERLVQRAMILLTSGGALFAFGTDWLGVPAQGLALAFQVATVTGIGAAFVHLLLERHRARLMADATQAARVVHAAVRHAPAPASAPAHGAHPHGLPPAHHGPASPVGGPSPAYVGGHGPAYSGGRTGLHRVRRAPEPGEAVLFDDIRAERVVDEDEPDEATLITQTIERAARAEARLKAVVGS